MISPTQFYHLEKMIDNIEAMLSKSGATFSDAGELIKVKDIVQDLQIYHHELESQNEELLRTRDELESLFKKYSRLYDFAPVSYLTINRNSTIIEVNQTFIDYFKLHRTQVLQKQLFEFVPEYLHLILSEHIKQTLSSSNKVGCELHRVLPNQELQYFRIESLAYEDDLNKDIYIHSAIIDITDQKKAQIENDNNREFLNNIIDAIPDPVFVKDELHNWMFINKAYTELTGVTREEKNLQDKRGFFANCTQSEFWDTDNKAFESSNRIDFEVKSDTEVCVRDLFVSKVVFSNSIDKQKYLVGIIRDVTEFKKMQEALAKQSENLSDLVDLRTKELLDVNHALELEISERINTAKALSDSEEKYKDYINNAPDGIVVIDINCNIIQFNKAACLITGYNSDEIMRIDVRDLLIDVSSDKSYIIKKLASISEFENANFEKALRTKYGEILYVLIDCVRLLNDKLIVFFKDITDRKIAEENLIKERSMLRTLINSIPDLIFIKDTKGKYLDCNKAFELFAAKKINDIIGRYDNSLFTEMVANNLQIEDLKVIQTKNFSRKEEWFEFPNGEKFLYDTIRTPFFDRDKAIVGVIGISRDVTVQKMLLFKREAEDKVLKGIANISTILLETKDYMYVLDDIMRILGEVTSVDRVYLFSKYSAENIENVFFTQISEWTNSGVEPQRNNPDFKAFDVEKSMPTLYENLIEKQAYYSLVRYVPESERQMLIEHDIKSLLIIPIFVKNLLWGFIGFDDTKQERIWRFLC